MFVTSHVLVGRIIGRALPDRPLTAFAVGVVSHLAMDATPHWGTAKGSPGSHEEFLRIARRDGIAGLVAIAASVAATPPPARRAVLAGIAGGALLDLDKPLEHFLGVNPFPEWAKRLHTAVQRESPRRLPYEVAVAIALSCTIAARACPRRSRPSSP